MFAEFPPVDLQKIGVEDTGTLHFHRTELRYAIMPSVLPTSQLLLGKRKRKAPAQLQSTPAHALDETTLERSIEGTDSGSSSSEDAESDVTGPENLDEHQEQTRDIFRRAFEKRFAPLTESSNGYQSVGRQNPKQRENIEDVAQNPNVQQQEDQVDEWVGFDTDNQLSTSAEDSETEPDAATIEVVNYAQSTNEEESDAFTRRHEARSFMGSKPPSSKNPKPKAADNDSDSDDPQTAQAHLKNDLALARLIRESDLLHQRPSLSSTDTNSRTKRSLQARQRTTESRLAALGAKDSILDQKNVPRAIKMGMDSRKREREEKRRKEAKENGIILEKPATKKKAAAAKRERSVGNPGIGKFRGGKLELGKRDLHKLTSKPSSERKRNGKRR